MSSSQEIAEAPPVGEEERVGTPSGGPDQTPDGGEGGNELMKSLSKKLSQSDLLETQDYSKFLKDVRKSIKVRIAALTEFGNYLAEMTAEAESGASLGGADGELNFETPHTAALKEARAQLAELYETLLAETLNQTEILERTIAIRRRTDTRMASLFEQIFAESSSVDKKLEAVNSKIKSYSQTDDATIQQRREIRKRLNKIKRERCILFGCVDVHPEELYQLTGYPPATTTSGTTTSGTTTSGTTTTTTARVSSVEKV